MAEKQGMASIFEQAQQLFLDEMNYWAGQARTYSDQMAKETEANLAFVREAVRESAAKGQAAVEQAVKSSDTLRRDVETRATALFTKMTELRAA